MSLKDLSDSLGTTKEQPKQQQQDSPEAGATLTNLVGEEMLIDEITFNFVDDTAPDPNQTSIPVEDTVEDASSMLYGVDNTNVEATFDQRTDNLNNLI